VKYYFTVDLVDLAELVDLVDLAELVDLVDLASIGTYFCLLSFFQMVSFNFCLNHEPHA